MAEIANIAVLDGEDAGSTPWEFDSITEIGGCTFALAASAAAHGDYGYEFSADGTNDRAYGTKSFTETSQLYTRYYIWIPSDITAVSGTEIVYIESIVDGALVFAASGFELEEDGPKRWYNTVTCGPTTRTTTTNFTTDAWHYVDIYYKRGSGDGQYQVWIDGDSVYQTSNLSCNEILPDSINVGQSRPDTVLSASDYFYIDDVLLSTCGPMGAYPYMNPGSRLAILFI